jgi:hypothetical protein
MRSLAGEHKGYVRGNPMGPNIVRRDFNGDGVVDLYMSEESPYSADDTIKAQAFTTHGEVLFTAPAEWNSPYIITGDINGDQCDEIISVQAGALVSLGIDGNTQELATWHSHYPDDAPSWCCDLNDDGTDEMLTGDGLVYDLVNDETWKLQWLSGWNDIHYDGIFGPGVFAVELAEIPSAQVAAIPAEGGIDAETFVLWSADGELLYAEHFGELIEAMAIAEAENRQYVVLLTESRLLIWP